MNDSFPPTIDGVSNTVFNYANILQKDHGGVIVATPEYPNVVDNYDFEVIRYPSVDTTKFIGYRAGVPLNFDLINTISNKEIDIIHSHCPVASTLLARTVRDTIEKPIVFTYHTKFDIDIKNATRSKLLQNLAINTLVSNIEGVDDVWVVSRGAGENLKSLGFSGDYIVMPNGVDFDKGQSSIEQINKIKDEYNLHVNVPIYLFVGRMMWYKGIKIILDALKIKKDHGQDFRMLFVGEGLEFDEIKEYTTKQDLDDKCIFAGSIRDRNKLKDIFSTCDVFLFPSTFDTNGIVVREAAAAGLGTILIKDSCASEDTIDKQNALYIEENAESLAKLLIETGDNVDYFHQIGKNAQNEIYISWQESIDRAYARYLEVSEKYVFDKRKMVREDASEALFVAFSDASKRISNARETRRLISEKYIESLQEVENFFTLNDYKDVTKENMDKIKHLFESNDDRYL